MNQQKNPGERRRDMLRNSLAIAGAGFFALRPIPLTATPLTMRSAMNKAFDNQNIQAGKVMLKLPQVAENGASVQFSVSVDSPADQTDYVKSIHIFSEKNPLPEVARFFLSPGAGKATVTTRIRLADSQTIIAVATLSDGSLWSGSAQSVVTLAACIDTV